MAQMEEHRRGSTTSRLLQCLKGLDSKEVLHVCTDASAMQSPLLQAVASEKARHLVIEQEQASWRHNVSGGHICCQHDAAITQHRRKIPASLLTC